MSDTARETNTYQTVDCASTDGLDTLFDIVATHDDIVATIGDSGSWGTVADVASSLNKSERSVQRYAKSGKLKSKTDESGRLLIWLATNADTFITPTQNVATRDDTSESINQSVATDADKTSINATILENERLWQFLKEKDAKIEALLMRNGYLQAQAETAQEAIKLLTDSQQKDGWWAKFSSWFFKAR
mgnify:CR=1 FL=1